MKAVTFIVVFCVPLPALASSPCECLYGWTHPGPGAKGVPLNVKLLVFHPALDKATFKLTKEGSSTAVEVDAKDHKGGGVWFTPKKPLEADTRYSYSHSRGSGSFTTGSKTDASGPTFASAAISGAKVSGACSEHYGARVTINGSSDDTTAFNELLARLTISGGGAKDKVVLVPLRSGAMFGRFGDPETSWQECVPSLAQANDEDTFKATVEVIDWAGNVSKPSKEVSFTFTYFEGMGGGCECSTAGGGEGVLLPLFVLMGLVLWARLRLTTR